MTARSRWVAIATSVVAAAALPAIAATTTADQASPAARGEVVRSVTLPAAPDGPRLPGGARIDDLLAEQLAHTPESTPLRVFVHGESLAAAGDAVAVAGLRQAFELPAIGVVAADGLPSRIRVLGEQPGLTYLEADAPITYALDHTHDATRGAEARTAFPGVAADIDGSGVTVAVIDSGVDGTHPFFTRPDGTSKVVVNLRETCEEIEVDTVVEGTCAAAGIDGMFLPAPGNDSDTMAAGGHGTHVAGIVAGVDTDLGDVTLHGAAPGAELVVLGTGRALVISAAVPALQWVLEHHLDPCGDGSCPPIRVINNSWSGPKEYDPDDVINKLQRELIAAGITVVWAASNDGGDGTSVQTSAFASEPTPGAISVANYDDSDRGTRDGALDSSSSRGMQGRLDTYPDLAAPGTNVLSSCRIHLPVCTGLDPHANGDFNSITGTSMAAPHIAGIVAQLLQADPSLTPADIEDVLEDTAYRFAAGAAYEPELDDRNPGTLTSFDKGHGLVDVVAALARVLGVTAPVPVDPCAPDGPLVTDPTGDATSLLGVVDGLPNEPSLDIVALTLTDDTDDLTAAIELDDLGESTSPTAGEGEYVEVFFTHADRDFYLSAQRDAGGGESYELGFLGTAGRQEVAPATGSFDPATDIVTVAVPLAATLDGPADIPALTTGTVLANIEAVSRRIAGVVIPDADHAPSACAYTVGVGNGAPPPPPATEETPDATLLPGGPSHTWSGSPTTGAQEPTGAGGVVGLSELILSGDGSVITLLELASSGTLSITLSADAPSDFDLYVYDMAGNEVAASETATADEHVAVDVPAGRYRVVVRTFVAVEATFTAVASLS